MDCLPLAPAWQAATAEFVRYQVLAEQTGVALRPPPQPPTSCCSRGCNGCVWEGFYAAVTFWCEDAEAALTTRD